MSFMMRPTYNNNGQTQKYSYKAKYGGDYQNQYNPSPKYNPYQQPTALPSPENPYPQNDQGVALKKGTVNGDQIYCNMHGYIEKKVEYSQKQNGRPYYNCPFHDRKYFLAWADGALPSLEQVFNNPNQIDLLMKKGESDFVKREDFTQLQNRIAEIMNAVEENQKRIAAMETTFLK